MTLAEIQKELPSRDFPWIREFVVRADGEVEKVVLDFATFRALLEEIEDRALLRAITEVQDEPPTSREEALRELQRD